ncbi:MAG: phage portal protein [Rhodobacter sp.]|nr:phage portal protein [Rhodobacter sp.]
MSFFGWLRPKAATQSAGSTTIDGPDDIERAIRIGLSGTAAGVSVTPDSAMRQGAVYACVRLISGAVANMPLDLKQRVDENTRIERNDLPLANVLRRKPNGWQKAAMFRRMLTAHLVLRGNAYAQIVRGIGGRVIALHPMHPDRVEPKQRDDLSLIYKYTRRDGGRVTFKQGEILHLVGLSLDGVTGVSVITYAREAIGLSQTQERHGATTFKNAARPSIVLTHPGQLGKEGLENLRTSVDQYRAGGESEGKALILEEDMKADQMQMTAEDAQWIESRKFSRSDIAMFFGVPPHMIGDTDKSTSWGTGIENMGIGFTTYTLEDYLTTWEQGIDVDLVTDPSVFAKFNRNALLRGDSKSRQGYYTAMLQWGVMSPNEIRALEDQNPREGGDIYYPPPNTAGKPDPDDEGNET